MVSISVAWLEERESKRREKRHQKCTAPLTQPPVTYPRNLSTPPDPHPPPLLATCFAPSHSPPPYQTETRRTLNKPPSIPPPPPPTSPYPPLKELMKWQRAHTRDQVAFSYVRWKLRPRGFRFASRSALTSFDGAFYRTSHASHVHEKRPDPLVHLKRTWFEGMLPPSKGHKWCNYISGALRNYKRTLSLVEARRDGNQTRLSALWDGLGRVLFSLPWRSWNYQQAEEAFWIRNLELTRELLGIIGEEDFFNTSKSEAKR